MCRWIYLYIYILCIETIYIESGVYVDYCIYIEREQCKWIYVYIIYRERPYI